MNNLVAKKGHVTHFSYIKYKHSNGTINFPFVFTTLQCKHDG